MPKQLMNHVRDCREKIGLTQQDVAGRVRVSRQTIVAIEKGNYTPSVALALELARLLRCSVEQLFFWQ
ncbi:MAG: helix-turn-helix domain-containing protein [Patescibacteria group bacterium]